MQILIHVHTHTVCVCVCVCVHVCDTSMFCDYINRNREEKMLESAELTKRQTEEVHARVEHEVLSECHCLCAHSPTFLVELSRPLL